MLSSFGSTGNPPRVSDWTASQSDVELSWQDYYNDVSFFCNFNRLVSILIISPLQSNFWHELLENHAKLESNFNGGWNGVWTCLSFYCRVYALLIATQVIGIKCQQKSMWRKEKNWTRGQLFSFWVTTLVYFAILQRFSAFLCQNDLWRYHVIIMLPFCSKTFYCATD